MKRSKFSLSHNHQLTMPMGNLVPIAWYETLPGDLIRQSTSALIRTQPLLAPVMHPVRVRIHHWFVPLRLIWDDFEDFITGGEDGTSTPVHPYISLGTINEGDLLNDMGIPAGAYGGNMDVSALPVRAYNLIYNERYRDQDLINEETIDTTSGQDTTSNTDLLRVAWEKDYFTTARPWEQKGDDIIVPLSGTAGVSSDGTTPNISGGGHTNANLRTLGSSPSIQTAANASSTADITFGDNTGLEAILSASTGVPISDLRLALALQRMREDLGRYGSRYSEYLKLYGVRSSDARLQEPEYLGGGKQVIQFSEVLQTAEGTDPVADMKGHGIAALKTNKYQKFHEEHGICMTLMSVIPKAIYTQAINRKWLRSTKEEYFQKHLQYIGEQQITNKEVYGFHSSPDDVFGYQARYDEYRNHPSFVSGEMHSTRNHWHMGRIHTGDIALNQSFIECNPTTRIQAAPTTDALICMAMNSIVAKRQLIPVARNKTF